jgi:hypothetical protein
VTRFALETARRSISKSVRIGPAAPLSRVPRELFLVVADTAVLISDPSVEGDFSSGLSYPGRGHQ